MKLNFEKDYINLAVHFSFYRPVHILCN